MIGRFEKDGSRLKREDGFEGMILQCTTAQPFRVRAPVICKREKKFQYDQKPSERNQKSDLLMEKTELRVDAD
jgi:hypothetical protein